MFIAPSYTITRPANTTQYGANELVANSETAGSVTPMRFNVSELQNRKGSVKRVRLFKNDTTTTAASFTVHLFNASPTVTNGDNGAFAVATGATYIGTVAIDLSSGALAATDGLWKAGALSPEIAFDATATGAIYGLLEVEGAYVPASGEQFTVTLDIEG